MVQDTVIHMTIYAQLGSAIFTTTTGPSNQITSTIFEKYHLIFVTTSTVHFLE
jgi:hypothetical protein